MQSRMGNEEIRNLRCELGEFCLENVDEVSRIFKVKYLIASQSEFLELGTGSIHKKIIRIEVRAGTVGDSHTPRRKGHRCQSRQRQLFRQWSFQQMMEQPGVWGQWEKTGPQGMRFQ